MKNHNSFTLKPFFEQWLPRLIALSILAYLTYSLFFRQAEFSWLHIAALAIVLALILAPVASRLKLLNLIDFNSKLDNLKQEQQETKSQLSALRNQISTVVSMSVSPIQQQTTIFTTNEFKKIKEVLPSFAKSEGEAASASAIEKDTQYTKEKFLRRAYGYRSEAYALLLMTIAFQVAMGEHRPYEPADFIEGDTMEEKIPNMLKRILDNGLDTVFPIRVIDEKSGETRSAITPEIVEGLKQINSLLDLCQKIENDKIDLPSRLDIDSLFDKIRGALATVGASLETVATHSILYQYRMTSSIKALKKELEQAEIEQRPMRFPPPNSD